MNTQILTWTNKATGETRIEIRVQLHLSVNVWQSQTDGRYYTIGTIGWWDITDTIDRYPH